MRVTMLKKDKLVREIEFLEEKTLNKYAKMKEIILSELDVKYGITKGFSFNGLSGSTRSKCKLRFLGICKGCSVLDWKINVVKIKKDGSSYNRHGGAHSFYISTKELREWLNEYN